MKEYQSIDSKFEVRKGYNLRPLRSIFDFEKKKSPFKGKGKK